MGQIVQMFGNRSLPAKRPDISSSAMRERMRRADVEDGIRRLLDAAATPRLALRLTRDHRGMLCVVACIDDGSPRAIGPAYPEERLDDFAGIVRHGLSTWMRPLSARLGMRVA